MIISIFIPRLHSMQLSNLDRGPWQSSSMAESGAASITEVSLIKPATAEKVNCSFGSKVDFTALRTCDCAGRVKENSRIAARAKTCKNVLKTSDLSEQLIAPQRLRVGEFVPMPSKKRNSGPASSLLLGCAGHAAMGVAFGLGFAFALTHISWLGVISYIDHSPSPREAMGSLVGTCVTTFGIGSTMTGLVLTKLRDINSGGTWHSNL